MIARENVGGGFGLVGGALALWEEALALLEGALPLLEGALALWEGALAVPRYPRFVDSALITNWLYRVKIASDTVCYPADTVDTE